MAVVAAELGVPLLAPDTQELLGGLAGLGWARAAVLRVRISGEKSRKREIFGYS